MGTLRDLREGDNDLSAGPADEVAQGIVVVGLSGDDDGRSAACKKRGGVVLSWALG